MIRNITLIFSVIAFTGCVQAKGTLNQYLRNSNAHKLLSGVELFQHVAEYPEIKHEEDLPEFIKKKSCPKTYPYACHLSVACHQISVAICVPESGSSEAPPGTRSIFETNVDDDVTITCEKTQHTIDPDLFKILSNERFTVNHFTDRHDANCVALVNLPKETATTGNKKEEKTPKMELQIKYFWLNDDCAVNYEGWNLNINGKSNLYESIICHVGTENDKNRDEFEAGCNAIETHLIRKQIYPVVWIVISFVLLFIGCVAGGYVCFSSSGNTDDQTNKVIHV